MKIVCHRGACLLAPENTFASADAAIASGADIVEFDVRQTSDGVHVIMHDRDVRRTTDGRGWVDHLTSQEVAALDAGAWFGKPFRGQRVPRLDEYLQHLKGRAGAYCEVKRGDADAITQIVRDAGMADDVFFFAFRAEVRDGLRRAAPGMVHMITYEIAGSITAAQSQHGAGIVEFTLEDVSHERIADARAAGLETMLYEAGNDKDRLARLLEFAPDYVNIDDIETFRTLRTAGA